MSPRLSRTFFVLGTVFVIAGGLVSAANQKAHWELGSWLVAYLVLVAGVAQAAIGPAQHRLAPDPVGEGNAWTQLVCWNVGNGLVMAGSLAAVPPVVDLGGVVLLVTLVLALLAVRGAPGSWRSWGFRAALVVLLISMPVGLVLSHLRAS